MTPLAALLLALLTPQDKDNAEEVFKRLEAKLARAESIHVEFKTTFEQQRGRGEKVSGLLNGSILLQAGNKARLEIDGRIGQPISERIVSDGKTTTVLGQDSAATPANLMRDAVLHLARASGVTVVMELRKNLALAGMDRQGKKPEPREADLATTMRLRDFKTGPSEMIDGRAAGAIQFVVEDVARSEKSLVTLWIDSETLLPIRRRVTVEDKGILIEETFTKFAIDGPIDPAKFDLPK